MVFFATSNLPMIHSVASGFRVNGLKSFPYMELKWNFPMRFFFPTSTYMVSFFTPKFMIHLSVFLYTMWATNLILSFEMTAQFPSTIY